MKRLFLLALVSTGAFSLSACGGDQIKHQGETAHAPKWVNQGAAAFKDGAFYGVGVASNISSISLRRSTADAQARAELAKVFTSKVRNLLKNYDASTTDGDKEAAEAHRQEATKVFTEMELSGTQIIDRYYDTEQRTMYALSRLDPDAFDGQLDQLARLNARTKQIIRDNAKRAFTELDQEAAKRAQ